jgi:peptidyl-prolyl cis-trans isomerase-like protein 2
MIVSVFQAIEQLNIKTKSWKDLLNDEAFQRKDLITLQDPHNIEKFNLSTFHHLRNNLKVENEGQYLYIHQKFVIQF